ncbi:MAG: hypothetical protein JXR91_15045 [Deltaproteobacteria bacterium]|nr:hypothetical protein [Deltaproteobacteria bacterium]
MFRQWDLIKYLSVLLIMSGMVVWGCSKDNEKAESCAVDSCGALIGAGVCDDESGKAVCTCNDGYVGDNCDKCADSYSIIIFHKHAPTLKVFFS